MELERELKFSVSDGFVPSLEELTAAFHGSGFQVRQGEIRAVLDRYLDDADGGLRRASLALRTRVVGSERLATLKVAGASDGALHERHELELPMVGDSLPEPIRRRIEAATDVDRLHVLAELRTERTVYGIERDGTAVAYLSFDAVEARRPDGTRGAHFHEVEVEAVGGTGRASLEAIAALLDPLLPLTPNSTTKLDRAEALLLLYGD